MKIPDLQDLKSIITRAPHLSQPKNLVSFFTSEQYDLLRNFISALKEQDHSLKEELATWVKKNKVDTNDVVSCIVEAISLNNMLLPTEYTKSLHTIIPYIIEVYNHSDLEILLEDFPKQFYFLKDIRRLKGDLESRVDSDPKGALTKEIKTTWGNELDFLKEKINDKGESLWACLVGYKTNSNNPTEKFFAEWLEKDLRDAHDGWDKNVEKYNQLVSFYDDYKNSYPFPEDFTLNCIKIDTGHGFKFSPPVMTKAARPIHNDEDYFNDDYYKQKWEDFFNNPNPYMFIFSKLDNWNDLPIDKLYEIKDENHEVLALFTWSKRLAAAATLNAELLRTKLFQQPEALKRIVGYRFGQPEKTHLNLTEIIGGHEEFFKIIENEIFDDYDDLRLYAYIAIGTCDALKRATANLLTLPTEKIYICRDFGNLPECRIFLAEFLKNQPKMFAATLEQITNDNVNLRDSAEFWLSIITDPDMLPTALKLFARDSTCPDQVWYDTVKRLLPKTDIVKITADLSGSCCPDKRDRLIKAQLKMAIGYALDKQQIETAVEIIINSPIISGISEEKKLVSEISSKIASANKNLESGFFSPRINIDQLTEQQAREVRYFFKLLRPYHEKQSDRVEGGLFSSLLPTDCSRLLPHMKDRYLSRISQADRDSSLVEKLTLGARLRLHEKIRKFIPDYADKIIELLKDDYPSRARLERILCKEMGWPTPVNGNETFKLLDQIDDDVLPGLLRESLRILVTEPKDHWHHYSCLATFLRNVYPDYPQAWTRAIVPLLDRGGYKKLDPEWTRALAICLAFLREPWGNKVPKLLRAMAEDASLGDFSETLKTQLAQFDHENFASGHHRLERRRIDDVKKYLARTSRLVVRKQVT